MRAVWKRILPELENSIACEATRRENARWDQRVDEAVAILKTYLEELPSACVDVLTTYMQLFASNEVKNMLDEDDASIPVTRERFDAVVPGVLKKQSEKNYVRLMDALRCALHPELSEDEAKLQPLPSLDSVIALFPCTNCSDYPVENNYTLKELCQHMKKDHLQGEGMRFWQGAPLKLGRIHLDIVRRALTMLGLPEDTRYQDISGRVVCLCGKPDFKQPVSFSALVSAPSLWE